MRGERTLLLALLACACDRPRPLLICHNASCVGPADPARDATLPALSESLALRRAGRPPFDGIELDLVHDGARGCRFAHGARADAPAARDAAGRVADFLAEEAEVAWAGRFHLFVDLKPGGPDAALAGCGIAVAADVAEGAARGGHLLEVVFSSRSPAVLRAVREELAGADLGGDRVEVRLAFDLGIPRPFGDGTRPLSEVDAGLVDVAAYPPDYLSAAQLQAVRALHLELAQWMTTTTVEALAAVERYRPAYVLTSELPLVRAWLED